MIGYIYATLLIASCVFVAVRGGVEERVALTTIVATSVATLINYRAGGGTFAELQPWLILSESTAMLVILSLAYRSRRYWPLVFAAFQIATLLSVLTPLFGRGLVSYALGMAQGIWAYLQLLLLIVATVRGQKSKAATRAPS